MISNLKPYPAYKSSGVPWLEEVPEHWGVQIIGGIGRLFKGSGGRKEDEVPSGVPCVRYGDLYTRHEFFVRTTKACIAPQRGASYTQLQYGDVLFAASGETIEDIGRSAVNLHEGPICCGGDILLLRPNVDVNAAFLGYAADAPASRYQKAGMGRGFTVVHIYAAELKRLALALPPLPEQGAIVRFLDHADRRIRRHIRAKQKLIKLLEEQKQVIIHHAVTRGLDPNVCLKPSGVEWLGDVPEHWEVTRLKFVAARIVDCLHATPHYSDLGKFPAIRTADISPGVVRLASARRVEADEFERWIQRLEPTEGDVLYSREGERFGIAACVPGSVRLCISQRMMVFRVRPEYNSSFIMWLLNSPQVYAQATQDVMGSTAPHVNVSTIRNYAIAVPPRNEQDAIVVHIEVTTSKLAQAIAAAHAEISLLREYRARLIADVVTGKLDVRNAAAPLPEEADEEELARDVEEITEEEAIEDTELETEALAV